MSEETRRKISAVQKGIKRGKITKEQSIQRSLYRKTYYAIEENRNRLKKISRDLRATKVTQITDKGEVIHWESQYDASDYLKGRPDRILDCCKGKINKHKKSKWYYGHC